MANYYGNNDWRDYQSLQHWDWPNGNNSSSYNHDYWVKNKAKILAQRARKAGKDAREFVTGENAKKELSKASNEFNVSKKKYDEANANMHNMEYFDKDDPDRLERDYETARKNMANKLNKKQEAEKKYNRTLKGFSESVRNSGINAINAALSKLKGSGSMPTRSMPQPQQPVTTASTPRGRKKTYGTGGGNANKGSATGSKKKVGKR